VPVLFECGESVDVVLGSVEYFLAHLAGQVADGSVFVVVSDLDPDCLCPVVRGEDSVCELGVVEPLGLQKERWHLFACQVVEV